MGNIRQNLVFAFVDNDAGLRVAAGAPYPFLGILLSPVVAASALPGGCVISDDLRLRSARYE